MAGTDLCDALDVSCFYGPILVEHSTLPAVSSFQESLVIENVALFMKGYGTNPVHQGLPQ